MMMLLFPRKISLPLLLLGGILALFVARSGKVPLSVEAAPFGKPSSFVSRTSSTISSRGVVGFVQDGNDDDLVVRASPAVWRNVPRGGGKTVDMTDPLTAGVAVICMAATPYVLGLFSKWMASKLQVYKTSTSDERLKAYVAESNWVNMYVALALSLTLFQWIEVQYLGKKSAEEVLKESFFVWSIFYTLAFIKVRIENHHGMLKDKGFGIQAWHSFVVVSMWAAIFGSEFLCKAMNAFFNLFSLPNSAAVSVSMLVLVAVLFWSFR